MCCKCLVFFWVCVAVFTWCPRIIISFPAGCAHLLLQMNVHKASHLSSKGQRAILIGFAAQSHYTAQLANIVLRLLLLMRVLLLKNELCHSASSGLLSRASPVFTFSPSLRPCIRLSWRKYCALLNIFQQDFEDINKGVSFFSFAKELGICECLEIGQPGEIMKGHEKRNTETITLFLWQTLEFVLQSYLSKSQIEKRGWWTLSQFLFFLFHLVEIGFIKDCFTTSVHTEYPLSPQGASNGKKKSNNSDVCASCTFARNNMDFHRFYGLVSFVSCSWARCWNVLFLSKEKEKQVLQEIINRFWKSPTKSARNLHVWLLCIS